MRLRTFLRRSSVGLFVVALVALAGPDVAGALTLAVPVLAPQASPSGFPAGAAVYSTGTLGLGVNPTGTITFRLFSPDDPGCAGTPVSSSTKPVSGNGFYTSDSFVANQAGTYRWVEAYSGDANNAASTTACADPAAAVTLAKRTPTLNTQASPLSVAGTIANTATLARGAGPAGPTGTITFSLYGPQNLTCAGTPAFTSTKAVSGNGTYPSDPFTPAAAGTYQWTSRYSGDANNNGAQTTCSDPANAVVVAPRVPLALTAGPATLSPGSQVSLSWTGVANPSPNDWVGLYGAGAPDYAAVAWRYTGGTAAGTVSMTVPPGARAGTYEARLFGANTNYQRLVTSNPFTVTAVAPPASLTLTAGPSTVSAGAQVTASWAGIPSPGGGDWVGLFATGTPDSAVIAWRYTGGAATGSVSLAVPAGTRAGTYELRLFGARYDYQRLATSNGFAVS